MVMMIYAASEAQAKFWIFGDDTGEKDTKVAPKENTNQRRIFVPLEQQKNPQRDASKTAPFSIDQLFKKKPKYSYNQLFWGGVPLPKGFDVTLLTNIGPGAQTQEEARMVAAIKAAPQEMLVKKRLAAAKAKRKAAAQMAERASQYKPKAYTASQPVTNSVSKPNPYIVRKDKADKNSGQTRKVFTDY